MDIAKSESNTDNVQKQTGLWREQSPSDKYFCTTVLKHGERWSGCYKILIDRFASLVKEIEPCDREQIQSSFPVPEEEKEGGMTSVEVIVDSIFIKAYFPPLAELDDKLDIASSIMQFTKAREISSYKSKDKTESDYISFVYDDKVYKKGYKEKFFSLLDSYFEEFKKAQTPESISLWCGTIAHLLVFTCPFWNGSRRFAEIVVRALFRFKGYHAGPFKSEALSWDFMAMTCDNVSFAQTFSSHFEFIDCVAGSAHNPCRLMAEQKSSGDDSALSTVSEGSKSFKH
jgi:hypothetical protein